MGAVLMGKGKKLRAAISSRVHGMEYLGGLYVIKHGPHAGMVAVVVSRVFKRHPGYPPPALVELDDTMMATRILEQGERALEVMNDLAIELDCQEWKRRLEETEQSG